MRRLKNSWNVIARAGVVAVFGILSASRVYAAETKPAATSTSDSTGDSVGDSTAEDAAMKDLLGTPATDGTVGDPASVETTESTSTAIPTKPVTSVEAQPDIGKDQLAVFHLQRGFYFSSDMGVFMTFLGQRNYSNIQPYVAVHAGYDLGNYVGLQMTLATGYSAGNPASASDDPRNPRTAGRNPSVNYSLFNMTGDLVAAFRPWERLSIEPKVGGGVTRMFPALGNPRDPSQKLSPYAPLIVGGVDIKYLTLLTDFSAGLALNTYYVLGPNVLAASVGGVVRYTF